MTQSLTVDVVSDVACPWCYLGKRRLEKAVTLVPEIAVNVRWRPYRLDPTIPPEGMDRTAYVVRKFGSVEALDAAHARLEGYGRAEGIDYRFDRITRSADTTNAHRLIRWAATEDKEDDIVERLFFAYFSEGLDIGSAAVLTAIAAETGMMPNGSRRAWRQTKIATPWLPRSRRPVGEALRAFRRSLSIIAMVSSARTRRKLSRALSKRRPRKALAKRAQAHCSQAICLKAPSSFSGPE